jgi:hypothetical protein
MVQLCNTLQKDMWLCIPHRADDDYVQRTAELVRDTLSPELLIYVEYSNETWNTAGAFNQTIYVQDQGEALGLAPDRWAAGQRFVALRSVQIWRIFNEIFGESAAHRLVRVMATQSANLSITRTRTDALNNPDINPENIHADALAIAPYFGRNFSPASLPPNVPDYPTVDEILDVLAPQTIEQAGQDVFGQKQVANAQGWQLICYEGGQHFVGVSGGENDTNLTALLTAANRDPRMGTRYYEYLDVLRSNGVEMFCNFSFCGEWSKWGSWGVLERLDQPLSEAPKYSALIDWIAAHGNCLESLQIQSIRMLPGGQLEIQWASQFNQRYDIEATTDFSMWLPVISDVPSEGCDSTVVLDQSTYSTRFYRVVQTDP